MLRMPPLSRWERTPVCGLIVLGFIAACAAPAEVAQSTPPPSCNIPAVVTPAPAYTPPADEIVADEPTAFYMLALTWAPEDCRETAGKPGYELQCGDNSFGFVLHGLWPNGAERRHPRYCGPAPAIAAETVRRHACMTPSTYMQQHEWAAHGTCGWTTPEAYFEQAATLWRALRAPSFTAPTLTAGQVRDAFVAANPWMRRDGIYIKAVDGNRLMDVRVCYDLQYRPMACRSVGVKDEVQLTIEPRRD